MKPREINGREMSKWPNSNPTPAYIHSTVSAALMFTVSYKALTTNVCTLVYKTMGSGIRKKKRERDVGP